MKQLYFCLLTLLFYGSYTSSAQILKLNATIEGIITDEETGEPLIGANIYIKSLKKGISSDLNGKFILSDIPKGKHIILFSYIGYHSLTQEITINNADLKKITIKLKPTPFTLNEVVITSKSEERKLREQAMPIAVISMKDLQGTVSDISDILSKTVGVTIRSSGGVGSAARISVRGLEGKRIGFYIDETPLTDQSDFLDLNDIPIDMIDRIEIYKGVVPAKFGGNSMGGAVNIVMKEYPDRYGDFSYSMESFNTHKAQTVFKRNLSETGWLLGAGAFYTYSDNNYTMKSPFIDDLKIKRDHDRFEKLALGGAIQKKGAWFDEIEFEPVYVRTKKQIQGVEMNIQKAESESSAFIFANSLKKEDFLLEGLDFDWSTAYAYTVFQFIPKKSLESYLLQNQHFYQVFF